MLHMIYHNKKRDTNNTIYILQIHLSIYMHFDTVVIDMKCTILPSALFYSFHITISKYQQSRYLSFYMTA